MTKSRTRHLLALFFVLFVCAVSHRPAEASGQVASLGQATASLTGPWRFATGDDPNWSNPSFDDRSWETVDMRADAGSRDGDVGILGYVPGWSARGHRGYAGFAWYRLRVQLVPRLPAMPMALTGPAAVDSAYQIYCDGVLMGGEGDFGQSPPVAGSIRPALYRLPENIGDGAWHLIAIRVWLDPAVAGAAGAGGIHVAPAIGSLAAAGNAMQLQWLTVIEGYMVDAAEPLLFVMLALISMTLTFAVPPRPPFGLLAVAMLATAALRANQVAFFWAPFETIHIYDLARSVVLTPLTLALWTIVWIRWFECPFRRVAVRAAIALAAALALSQLAGRAWFCPVLLKEAKAPLHLLNNSLRWVFVLLYAAVVVRCAMEFAMRFRFVAALACSILAGIGIFAEELSALGIPAIWFPFGIGVSRTQYAYAAMVLVLFALLLASIRDALIADEKHRQRAATT